MQEFSNFTRYDILGTEVFLLSIETDCGNTTIAEINEKYYYIGELDINLTSAGYAWQYFSDRDLTVNEWDQILEDNL